MTVENPSSCPIDSKYVYGPPFSDTSFFNNNTYTIGPNALIKDVILPFFYAATSDHANLIFSADFYTTPFLGTSTSAAAKVGTSGDQGVSSIYPKDDGGFFKIFIRHNDVVQKIGAALMPTGAAFEIKISFRIQTYATVTKYEYSVFNSATLEFLDSGFYYANSLPVAAGGYGVDMFHYITPANGNIAIENLYISHDSLSIAQPCTGEIVEDTTPPYCPLGSKYYYNDFEIDKALEAPLTVSLLEQRGGYLIPAVGNNSGQTNFSPVRNALAIGEKIVFEFSFSCFDVNSTFGLNGGNPKGYILLALSGLANYYIGFGNYFGQPNLYAAVNKNSGVNVALHNTGLLVGNINSNQKLNVILTKTTLEVFYNDSLIYAESGFSFISVSSMSLFAEAYMISNGFVIDRDFYKMEYFYSYSESFIDPLLSECLGPFVPPEPETGPRDVSGVSEITDYCAIAKSRLLEQFKNKTNLINLLCNISQQANESEEALANTNILRLLDNSNGIQLDEYGLIVGLDRNSLSDDDYEAGIRLKSSINAGYGAANTLIEAIKLYNQATEVTLQEVFPSRVLIFANGSVIPNNLNQVVKEITAAGVALELVINPGATGADTFTFAPDGAEPDLGGLGFAEYLVGGGQLTEKVL